MGRGSRLRVRGLNACQKSNFGIARDIGHETTIHPGATSARGIAKFTYNHALAELALSALKANGFVKAVLIGESGSPMPLADRAGRKGGAVRIPAP
jgi:hypothetical protein